MNSDYLFPQDLLILDNLMIFYKKNYPDIYLSKNLDNELQKFKDNTTLKDYQCLLNKCFAQISIKDFFTTFSESLEKKKISLYSFSTAFLEPFFEIAINQLCDPILIKDNKEIFQTISIRLLNSHLLSTNDISKIVKAHNFDDYKNNNTFLTKIHNFKTMLQLCEISKNFDPWIVINKLGNIETFWATHVASVDSLIQKPEPYTTKLDNKINFFKDNISKWEHISTQNSTNRDLKSRIFSFLLLSSNTKAYKKLQQNINDLNLTDYNLNVEDYIVNIKDKSTLKEKFIKYGFFKILDLTKPKDKSHKTASIEDLHNIINSSPKNIHHINTHKSFVKIYTHTSKNNEDLHYEDLLLKILNNSVKKITTFGIQYHYKCFFPVKNKYLDLHIDDLMIRSKSNNKYNPDSNIFLGYSTNTNFNFENSFDNLLDYLCKKNNINWNTMVTKDQCNLFTSCFKVLSQREHISYNNSKLLEDKNNLFINKFKNELTEIEKVKSLEFIKENWQTDFLSGHQLSCYHTQYTTFKSNNNSIFVYYLQEIFNHIIENKIQLPENFFDEKMQSLISTLNKYDTPYIRELVITLNYLDQSSSIDLNKKVTVRKANKI